MCPSRGLPTVVPALASQIRMVLSAEPEMICRPSGVHTTDHTPSVCPFRGLLTAAPVSTSQIRIVMSLDPVAMWYPFGEQQMDMTAPVCPIHCNGGAGHDNNFPLCVLMVLVNHVPKMVDKGDSEGRNGPVGI